jgi:hypothetical protein
VELVSLGGVKDSFDQQSCILLLSGRCQLVLSRS